MEHVVTVSGGRVRGVQRGEVWSFTGIPYAAPPVGSLRWRPPQEPERWSEVRDGSAFGPIAPQPAAVAGITSPSDPSAAEPQDEDCLSLNVWTPELPADPSPGPGAGRPVMVWIHGGGFTGGSGSVALYRGGDLVRNGDVIVVTINYRLGALGFLGHPCVTDADGYCGSWGLHDQVAALRWVQENIAQFGGDAGNVTIFGESAGGFSVTALLAAPMARGLFRRAIVQSGGAHVHTSEQGELAGVRLGEALGLAQLDRETLLTVPAVDLVAGATAMAQGRPDAGSIPLPFLPVIDGSFLPEHPLDAVQAGSAAGVDVVIGTNRDELTLFSLGNPALAGLDDRGVHRWIANAAPDVPTDELLESYRTARSARQEGVSAQEMWVAVGTDNIFRWPSLQLAAAQQAQGSRTFVYLFDWESPAFGGILGSCHALELPFVFGAVRSLAVQLFSGSGPPVDALSQQMQSAWLAFARTGDPSGGAAGDWPAWDPDGRVTMIFGGHSGVAKAPRNEELDVWERYRPLPSGVS
jgi:para-nitrobenzyl esterase